MEDDVQDSSTDEPGRSSTTSTAVQAWQWAPEIGQRVRIWLSAECPLLRAAPGEKETRTAWHSHSEDGMTGRVVWPTPGVWMPRMDLPDHLYLVAFDPEAVHFAGCISYAALYFAAPELEPIPEDNS